MVVTDPGETTDDLEWEMVDALTAFCARLYGRWSARTRGLRTLTATRTATQRRPRRSLPPPDGLRR